MKMENVMDITKQQTTKSGEKIRSVFKAGDLTQQELFEIACLFVAHRLTNAINNGVGQGEWYDKDGKNVTVYVDRYHRRERRKGGASINKLSPQELISKLTPEQKREILKALEDA